VVACQHSFVAAGVSVLGCWCAGCWDGFSAGTCCECCEWHMALPAYSPLVRFCCGVLGGRVQGRVLTQSVGVWLGSFAVLFYAL
jgi:hypothetical protein